MKFAALGGLGKTTVNVRGGPVVSATTMLGCTQEIDVTHPVIVLPFGHKAKWRVNYVRSVASAESKSGSGLQLVDSYIEWFETLRHPPFPVSVLTETHSAELVPNLPILRINQGPETQLHSLLPDSRGGESYIFWPKIGAGEPATMNYHLLTSGRRVCVSLLFAFLCGGNIALDGWISEALRQSATDHYLQALRVRGRSFESW